MSYVPSVNFYGMLSDLGDNVLAAQERRKQEELDAQERAAAQAKGFPVPTRPNSEGFLQRLTRTITGEPAPQPQNDVVRPVVPNAAPVAPTGAPMVGGNAFANAVGKTLGYEGGYTPHDSNGAPANFGVNQAANPDVNVKGLSKEQAIDLYKKRYWDAIGGDEIARYNPTLATIAFDTAVNSGPQKARDLLAYSNGDPARYLDLREKFLKDLAASHPEKFNSDIQRAWANRIADLRGTLNQQPQRVQVAGPLPESTAAKFSYAGGNPTTAEAPVPDWIKSKFGFATLDDIKAGMNNKFMKPYAQKALDAYFKEVTKTPPETWEPLNPNEPVKQGSILKSSRGDYKVVGGGPSTTVNVAGEKAYKTKEGAGYAEDMRDIQKQGRASTGSISSLNLLEKAIDTPGFYSGTAPDAVLALKKAAVSLGIGDVKDAAPNELFAKISNKLVLDLAGGSLGTGFSNADRDYLAGTVPNLGNTPEGNKQIIQIMKKVEARKGEIAKFARDYAKEHNGEIDLGFDDALAQWSEKNPLFKNEPPAAAPKLGSVPIPPERAEALKRHPDLRKEFDAQYGAGAAERILGPEKKRKSEPET